MNLATPPACAMSPSIIEDGLTMLPAFPGIVIDALETMNDEGASMTALVEHLRRDPLIACQVLSMANRSARYSQRPAIREIYPATVLLGMQRIREIILTVSLADFSYQLGRERQYWEHSLAVGICAQELARQCHINPEYALVAGLLHDIGQIWMSSCQPRKHERVVSLLDEGKMSVCAAERQIFGLDHGQLGYWMVSHWGLPEEIRDAVAQHHMPEQGVVDPMVAVVHLAEAISNGLDLPYRPNNQVMDVSDVAVSILGLDLEKDGVDLLGRVEARYRYARARLH